MDRSERIALGALALVIAGFAIFIAAMQAEWGREAQFHAELAYAKDNLGGAGYAAIAKGGDPDAGGTQEEKAGESGNEGNPVSQAAEEAAARAGVPRRRGDTRADGRSAAGVRRHQDPRQQGLQEGSLRLELDRADRCLPARRPRIHGAGLRHVRPRAGDPRRPEVQPGPVPGLDRGRGRRRLDDEARSPHQQPRLVVLVGGARLERVRDARPGPDRPVGQHALRRARASRTRRPTPRRASGSTSRRTAATRGSSSGSTDELFKTRAVSSIAIDPTDGNTMYAAIARAVRGVTSVSGGAVSRTGAAQPTLGVYKTTNGGATWSLVWDAGLSATRTPAAARAGSRSTRSTTRRSTRARTSSASTARRPAERSSRSSRRRRRP